MKRIFSIFLVALVLLAPQTAEAAKQRLPKGCTVWGQVLSNSFRRR